MPGRLAQPGRPAATLAASLAVAAALLAGLAGCASTAGQSGKAELRTASDQTAGEKRSAIRLQLATGYYQQGQYEVALDEAKKAIDADPTNADAVGIRALTYMAMGQTTLADDNFQRALGIAPNDADIASNYALFLCQNGRVAESFKYFDAALANRTYRSPQNAYNNAGSCALQVKDYVAAEKYLLPAFRFTPDVPSTNVNLARLYYARKDYQRAGFFISRLSKIATMESLTADVLWLAIKVQHQLGDAAAEAGWATQLRRHYAGSPEYAAYQRGAFDE